MLGSGAKRGKYGAKKFEQVNVTNRFPVLNMVATEKATTAEALILAWMLHRWQCLVHIIGARSAGNLENSLSATRISLTAEQVAAIEADV